MSANEFLIDSGTRHQIYVQRYAGGQVKEILLLLKQMVSDIQRELDAAKSLSQAQRLSTRLSAVQSVIDDAMDLLDTRISANIDDFAQYEAEFAVRALNTATGLEARLPEASALRAVVTGRPMTLITGNAEQTLTIPQAIRDFSAKKKREIGTIIQTGFVDGKTTAQIVRDVDSLVARRTRKQAESLIRTSVNHIGTEARALSYQANSDILKGEQWLSTLDSRTTITCASLDGKVFPIGQGPMTPRHWQCRSVRVPVLDDRFSDLDKGGTRMARPGDGDPVRISAKRTYSGWLRDQPIDFQNEVLGLERAKLFRSGGLSLSRFTDDYGRVYSLDQLRQLEPQIFQ